MTSGLTTSDQNKLELTGGAVVNVYLTVASTVSLLTQTHVAAFVVNAMATVFAGILPAFVHVLCATLTFKHKCTYISTRPM